MFQAVITGDLVASSKLNAAEYDWAMEQLESVLSDCNTFLKGQGDAQIQSEIYRGDGFQLMTDQFHLSATVAVFLKVGLLSDRPFSKPLNSTISIGLGVDTRKNNATSLGRVNGPAFQLSGRGLDKTPKGSMSFHCTEPNESDSSISLLENTVSKSLALCDLIVSGLTEKQSQLLYQDMKLGFPSNSELALALGMSEQSTSNIKTRIGAKTIYQYLDMLQILIQQTYRPTRK